MIKDKTKDQKTDQKKDKKKDKRKNKPAEDTSQVMYNTNEATKATESSDSMKRTSLFKANVSGYSAWRMYRMFIMILGFLACFTFLNSLLSVYKWYIYLIPLFVTALVALFVFAFANKSNFMIFTKIATFCCVFSYISSWLLADSLASLDTIIKICITVAGALLAIIFWVIQEEKFNKAKERCYYFYDDMIECVICEEIKRKRQLWSVLHGIVDVKMDMPLDDHKHPVKNFFANLLVVILGFSFRPLWKHKYKYRNIIVSPTGKPEDDIVLVDVENPEEVISNIKKHYTIYSDTKETFSRGVQL